MTQKPYAVRFAEATRRHEIAKLSALALWWDFVGLASIIAMISLALAFCGVVIVSGRELTQ